MNNKGFTLLETLIVLLIIGVIASIVMFSVGDLLVDVDKQAIEANLRTAQTGMERHYINNRSYPENEFDNLEEEDYNKFKEELNPFYAFDDLESNLQDEDNITYEKTDSGYILTIIVDSIDQKITLTERGVQEWENI